MTRRDDAKLERIAALRRSVITEVSKAFVGPEEISEMLLVALLARGHVLLEGVPGVAKTTLVKAFSQTLGCAFKRIQFTPDLLPADITGTYILDMRDSTFTLREGPIFANVVLGDEINRAPAKTQSALLEAMQEAQVTIEGETRLLDPPFMVLATQNPIEQEGTYPLPEAQVDRFLLKIAVDYPDVETERRMMSTYNRPLVEIDPVLDPVQIIELQQASEETHIDDELIDYIIALARFTRDHRRVYLGVSPRASLMLMQASKAKAILSGRAFVLPDDIKALASPVMGHRIILAPEAELEGMLAHEIVNEALDTVRYQRRH